MLLAGESVGVVAWEAEHELSSGAHDASGD